MARCWFRLAKLVLLKVALGGHMPALVNVRGRTRASDSQDIFSLVVDFL